MAISSPNTQLHVLIVGAGIAGLAAARALSLNGHKVEIFERCKFNSEVGAAVTISPNGTRVLRSFGFDFKKVGGVAIRHIRGYNAITFEPRFDHDFGDAEEMCGAPHEAMHRQDLHRELERLALLPTPSNGSVKIHQGVKIIRINPQTAEIELDNGQVFSGDLLIGADGLHSDVRAAAIGKREEPIDTEWQIYRFLLPREKVMNDEIMRGMRVENARLTYVVPDPKSESTTRLTWYECRNGEVENFAGFYRGDEDQTKVEDFGRLADKNTVLRLFGHMNPKLVHIINQAQDILYWRVYERLPLPAFTYGRTILIGDAAHAMTPFTAAGATQALEDAGALLGLFSNLPSLDALARRMQIFDQVRVVRASRVQLGAVMKLKSGEENPLLPLAKDLMARDDSLAEGIKVLGTEGTSRERLLSDYRYDVLKVCAEALEREG